MEFRVFVLGCESQNIDPQKERAINWNQIKILWKQKIKKGIFLLQKERPTGFLLL